MSEEVKILKKIELKLDQLLKWTRFAGMQQLRTILTHNLKKDTTTLIYEYSDGNRSTRDVAKIVGSSHQKVATYWQKWSTLGIVEPSPKYKGRFQRICSIEEVGLTLPPLPKKDNKSTDEEVK